MPRDMSAPLLDDLRLMFVGAAGHAPGASLVMALGPVAGNSLSRLHRGFFGGSGILVF